MPVSLNKTVLNFSHIVDYSKPSPKNAFIDSAARVIKYLERLIKRRTYGPISPHTMD